MAKIKEIREDLLKGGTTKDKIYPITVGKAVYVKRNKTTSSGVDTTILENSDSVINDKYESMDSFCINAKDGNFTNIEKQEFDMSQKDVNIFLSPFKDKTALNYFNGRIGSLNYVNAYNELLGFGNKKDIVPIISIADRCTSTSKRVALAASQGNELLSKINTLTSVVSGLSVGTTVLYDDNNIIVTALPKNGIVLGSPHLLILPGGNELNIDLGVGSTKQADITINSNNFAKNILINITTGFLFKVYINGNLARDWGTAEYMLLPTDVNNGTGVQIVVKMTGNPADIRTNGYIMLFAEGEEQPIKAYEIKANPSDNVIDRTIVDTENGKQIIYDNLVEGDILEVSTDGGTTWTNVPNGTITVTDFSDAIIIAKKTDKYGNTSNTLIDKLNI